jgi:mRNA-degrading endonuclease RelE of RelBE toxin-antitoxin system
LSFNVNSRKLNDKRTEIYSLRITPTLKEHLEKLSPTAKTKLHEDLMIAMAKAAHENNFNPAIYLGMDEGE